MKIRIKKNKVISLIVMAMFLVSSCVKDDDYSVPDISITEPSIPQDKITTFSAIKSLYEQASKWREFYHCN